MYAGLRIAAVLGSTTFLSLGSGGRPAPAGQPDVTPTIVPAATMAGTALTDPVSGAVIGHGFCFFVLGSESGPSGYSGAGQRVDTPSGRVSYHCKADLLFGEPATRAIHLRDVPFTDFLLGTMESCDIHISAGGEANVQCHE